MCVGVCMVWGRVRLQDGCLWSAICWLLGCRDRLLPVSAVPSMPKKVAFSWAVLSPPSHSNLLVELSPHVFVPLVSSPPRTQVPSDPAAGTPLVRSILKQQRPQPITAAALAATPSPASRLRGSPAPASPFRAAYAAATACETTPTPRGIRDPADLPGGPREAPDHPDLVRGTPSRIQGTPDAVQCTPATRQQRRRVRFVLGEVAGDGQQGAAASSAGGGGHELLKGVAGGAGARAGVGGIEADQEQR